MNSVLQAVMSNRLSALRAAIDAGGDVDARDADGGTPLMQAAIQGQTELARELLRGGANVNAQNRQGWTALHFAAQEHHVEVAKLLLEYGLAIDTPDVHGNTPLWRAVFASQGRGEMIHLLLGAGADSNRKNKYGVSPSELANTIANYDVKQFFK